MKKTSILKNEEKRLLALLKKEKKNNKYKTESISVVAHQLQAPLTAMSWYIKMILNGDVGQVTPDQKKYIEEIYKGNKRMIELVNTLLNISHLELKTFILTPELVDLKDVVESVLADFKIQILSKKIAFTKNYDQNLPVVSTDLKLIRMVFQNLLGNAVKYVGVNGKIIFDISMQKSDILVKVWNDGVSIPIEAQSKIFTKFFRDNLAKENEPEGNGLGLYIVKSILKKLGGKVWFESIENKGTTFYFLIPLAGIKKHKEKA